MMLTTQEIYPSIFSQQIIYALTSINTNTIACGSNTGSITIISFTPNNSNNTSSFEIISQLQNAHGEYHAIFSLLSITTPLSEIKLISCGEDSKIKIWHLTNTFQFINNDTINYHDLLVTQIIYINKTTFPLFCSVNFEEVILWETTSPYKCIHKIFNEELTPYKVSYIKSNDTIVICDLNKKCVMFWEIEIKMVVSVLGNIAKVVDIIELKNDKLVIGEREGLYLIDCKKLIILRRLNISKMGIEVLCVRMFSNNKIVFGSCKGVCIVDDCLQNVGMLEEKLGIINDLIVINRGYLFECVYSGDYGLFYLYSK